MSQPSDPRVSIHAKLPDHPWGHEQHLELDTWTWCPCLSAPTSEVIRLQPSPHPTEWLGMCMETVLGAKGKFYLEEDELVIVGDNHPLSPNDSLRLYYHVDQDEQRQMLPVDPYLLDTHLNGIDVPTLNTRDQGFPRAIRDRDATSHNASNARTFSSLQAAHLVPHSKGHDYIHTLTSGRSRGIPGDVMSRIDDVRNGVLLDPIMHSTFGTDFAMLWASDDVAVGNASAGGGPPSATMTLTPHDFNYPNEVFGDPVRIPGPDFPSHILLNAVYGSVVLRYFGADDITTRFKRIWGERYYPGGRPMSHLEAETTRLRDDRARQAATKAQQDLEREERLERRRCRQG